MSTAAITTITRNLSEWAGTANEKFLRIDQEQQLASSLGDPRRRAQVHVAAWMLGTWHLGAGFVQVMSGNGRGFDDARIGQGLRRCSLLLRHRHFQPQRRAGAAKQSFSVMQGALTALLGLALQDPGAEELYDILLAQPDSTFGEKDHLPMFVRELLRVRAGDRPNVASRLGPYEEVFRHWTGDARLLAQHLATTLDVHLQQVRGEGSTFDDPPCRLYPAEVLAVRNVRKWLSLPTPKVEHALMFTNLVMMPPDEPWPQHDLVQKLERTLRAR